MSLLCGRLPAADFLRLFLSEIRLAPFGLPASLDRPPDTMRPGLSRSPSRETPGAMMEGSSLNWNRLAWVGWWVLLLRELTGSGGLVGLYIYI